MLCLVPLQRKDSFVETCRLMSYDMGRAIDRYKFENPIAHSYESRRTQKLVNS